MNRNKQATGQYIYIDNDGLCVYCGLRANSLDHFVPFSVAVVFQGLVEISGKYLLPACSECNSIAGAKCFKTVKQKRIYIQSRLIDKYYLIYDMPLWTEDDLEEMGYSLKNYILSSQGVQEWIKRRVLWSNKDNPAYARIAAIRFVPIGNGRNIALERADKCTIIKSIDRPLKSLDRLERRYQ